ncbi:MAG TPA: threonine synthase [Lachnospiraceae bacterium]|nr:threonine synthase [Lachnospiraceae bacterium]
MSVMYKSTRSDTEAISASAAIIQGLAEDGGLFVPTTMPKLSVAPKDLVGLPYQEVAYLVMKEFLTDFTEQELRGCIQKAYDEKFDTKAIAPLVQHDGRYFLELFHGATIAFKDMALSILPHLLTTSLKKNHVDKEIVILTATSGDTGKAALAGFADVEGTSIIVFYPKGGVSPIQEKQMLTQKGANTTVIGVHGNFDDCQTGVKKMFSDVKLREELAQKGYQFSSANSINIGRLVPQVAYYAYAYACMLAQGEIKENEPINVVVPTGNFGNILAAYYAKQMGIPIDKLICASNENKVLFDFFESGCYDRNREFILTSSPSMDILISSNLERLIYQIAGAEAKVNADLMKDLREKGVYHISEQMRENIKDFCGIYASEAEVFGIIQKIYKESGYVIDTHTAVATAALEKYQAATGDTNKCVIISTASPYKFSRSVMEAIDEKYKVMEDFALIDEMSTISGVKVPNAIEEIRTAPILHKGLCDKTTMQETVRNVLGLS